MLPCLSRIWHESDINFSFESIIVAPKHKKDSHEKVTKDIHENGKKKSYASHVMSTGNVYPLHGGHESYYPDFNFHYKTHDIPNENELSLMITGHKPKKPDGVSLVNIAKEAATKALNGKVIPNDDADKLGMTFCF